MQEKYAAIFRYDDPEESWNDAPKAVLTCPFVSRPALSVFGYPEIGQRIETLAAQGIAITISTIVRYPYAILAIDVSALLNGAPAVFRRTSTSDVAVAVDPYETNAIWNLILVIGLIFGSIFFAIESLFIDFFVHAGLAYFFHIGNSSFIKTLYPNPPLPNAVDALAHLLSIVVGWALLWGLTLNENLPLPPPHKILRYSVITLWKSFARTVRMGR